MPALAAAESPADEGWGRLIDVANPYTSAEFAYDSNVFRSADEIPVVGGHSDRYATISAGFEAKFDLSQQQLELAGVVSRSAYDAHDELDHTAGRAAAIWKWSAGGAVAGSAGFRHNRMLRDFANQASLERVVEIRSENRYLASADVDLPGNWKIGVHGEFADISFSETEALDVERTSGGAALDFVSRAGNVMGFQVRVVNGDYVTNPAADYDEYSFGPTLQWQLTAKTIFTGTVGYTQRNSVSSTRADYGDVTGRLSLKVTQTDQANLTATAWRELSNLGDEIADFTLIHGLSIEPQWQLSERLGIRLIAAYEDREFNVDAGEDRQDDVFTGGISADWSMGRNFDLACGINAQSRSSTRLFQDYNFHELYVRITLSF